MITSFENELQKGTGLAFLLLKKSILTPSDAIDKIIFDNLATNFAYDPQCEGSRHEYIYNMVQFYPRKQHIYSMVLNHFEKMTLDDYGARQIFGFVEKLVEEKVVSKEKLYEKFLYYASKDIYPYMLGVEELILADDIEGIVFIARYFGKNITEKNHSDFAGLPFFDGFSKKIGLSSKEVLKILKEKQDPDIERFLSVITLKCPKQQSNIVRESATELVEKLRKGRSYLVRKWLRTANVAEIQELSRLFKYEKNLDVRKKLLIGFRHIKIDVPLEYLISEFVKTRDVLYRESLVDAMLLFGDDSVLKLCDKAYSKVFRVTWIKACSVFYNDSYAWRLRLELEELDHNEIHEVLKSIIRSSALAKASIYHSLLRILYRKNRCSICRRDIVQRIIETGSYDLNFIEEIKHDCDEDIRKFANEAKLTNVSA